jgi:hypothetical protein
LPVEPIPQEAFVPGEFAEGFGFEQSPSAVEPEEVFADRDDDKADGDRRPEAEETDWEPHQIVPPF